MIDDIEMLKTITETADMGRDSLNHLLDKDINPQLKDVLQKQYNEYNRVFKRAEELLNDNGKSSQKIGAPIKMYSHMISNMKTMTAKNSTSEIAEMVIQGSTMGVTEMTKILHEYKGNNQNIRDLAQNHILTEQTNIEEMKKYL